MPSPRCGGRPCVPPVEIQLQLRQHTVAAHVPQELLQLLRPALKVGDASRQRQPRGIQPQRLMQQQRQCRPGREACQQRIPARELSLRPCQESTVLLQSVAGGQAGRLATCKGRQAGRHTTCGQAGGPCYILPDRPGGTHTHTWVQESSSRRPQPLRTAPCSLMANATRLCRQPSTASRTALLPPKVRQSSAAAGKEGEAGGRAHSGLLCNVALRSRQSQNAAASRGRLGGV